MNQLYFQIHEQNFQIHGHIKEAYNIVGESQEVDYNAL